MANRDNRLPAPRTLLAANVGGFEITVQLTTGNDVVLTAVGDQSVAMGFRSLSGVCSWVAGHRRNGFRDFGLAA